MIESLEGAYRLAYSDSIAQSAVLQGLRAGTYIRGGSGFIAALARNPGASSLDALEKVGDVLVERGLYGWRTMARIFRGHYQTASTFIQEETSTSPSARLYRAWTSGILLQRNALSSEAIPDGVAAPLCTMDVYISYRTTGCFYHVILSEAAGDVTVREQALNVLTQSETSLREEGDPEWADVAEGYQLALDGIAALQDGNSDGHAMLDRAHIKLDAIVVAGGEFLPMEIQVGALVDAGEAERALPYAEMIQFFDPYGHYLEGRIHEVAGNPEAAREAYEAFTSAWRDADPDIAALEHAKAVLAGTPPAEAPPL